MNSRGIGFGAGLIPTLDSIYSRIERKKAAVIIIDGQSGEGKTTLAIHIADYYNAKVGQAPVDLKSCQLSMGGLQFVKNADEVARLGLPVLIYDESGDFDRTGGLTKFNKMINRHFDTYRSLKHIVIMCIPNCLELPNSLFRKGLPRIQLRCYDRTMNCGNIKMYSQYRMRLARKFFKKYDSDDIYAYHKARPNLRLHFQDIDQDRSEQLDKISTAAKRQIRHGMTRQHEGLSSRKEVEIQLNRSTSWVKNAVMQLGIKAHDKVGQSNYYSKEQVQQLRQHSEKLRRDRSE